jgi:hypothetical protein
MSTKRSLATITRVEWSKKHPLNISTDSDKYYVNLANRIIKALKNDKVVSTADMSPFAIKYSAMLSTLYFEDIVSQTGLFNSFRKIHTRMYGKKLPFIEISDDYEDYDVNPEDIQFLIWCIVQEENIIQDMAMVINIENPLVSYTSHLIYDILDTQFESAPVNKEFYKTLYKNDYIDDFIMFRKLLDWLHYDSYLSMIYPEIEFFEEAENFTAELKRKDLDKHLIEYGIRNSRIFSSACSPLAIHAVEWFGELGISKIENIVSSIEFRPLAGYKIEKYDKKFIYLSDQDKKEFVMDINSLQANPNFKTYDYVTAALVMFNGVWQLNGFALFGDAKDVKTEMIELKNAEKAKESKEKILAHAQIMKYSNNKPVLFFRTYKDWINFMMTVFSKTSNMNLLESSDFKNEKNFVFFSHPEFGSMLAPNLAAGIKAPENTFYRKICDPSIALGIVCGIYGLPFEFLDYLLKNNLLSDASINSLQGPKHGKKLVQENIEFMARFFNHRLYK